MIEQAYLHAEQAGLAVYVEDEAGPYQAVPHLGEGWQPVGEPARQPHEYIRAGTAKLLTLFHPASGQLHVKGVTSCPNVVLHPWLQQALTDVLDRLPEAPMVPLEQLRRQWLHWQEGLSVKVPLPETLPSLRMLLVLDNLKGHKTPAFVRWLVEHGVMPLYTPIAGSWLNMAESIQRIIVRRALAGQSPTSPEQIIEWLEATARGWNRHPTPFVWGGRRKARRDRARSRRHALGGSGAYSRQVIS